MIRYVVAAARPQGCLRARPFHTWNAPDGTAWTDFYRTAKGYLLRFPGLADFAVSAAGRSVTCRPVPGIAQSVVNHLYLNQVRPLALSRQGHGVLHAGAVELEGAAIAFVGSSGNGKSTLVASFAAHGHRFLCDDALVVQPDAAGYQVIPGHPSIRLWDDARNAVLGSRRQPVAALQVTAKWRLESGPALAHCPRPLPLHRVYFLGEPRSATPRITPIPAAETLVRLVRNSFMLEIEERASIAAHFNWLTRLSRRPIHFSLEYPRRFDGLERIRALIIEHARHPLPLA